MVVFVVSVNQKIGILVLFVVLYHTLEKPAFCLTYVVRIALLIWTFCVVDDVVLMFFLCLIFDEEFGAEFFGVVDDLDFGGVGVLDGVVDVFFHFVDDRFTFVTSIRK